MAIDAFLPAPLASERALRDLRFSLQAITSYIYDSSTFLSQIQGCYFGWRSAGREFRGGYSQTDVRSQTFLIDSKMSGQTLKESFQPG
jgi:hypothetical protein